MATTSVASPALDVDPGETAVSPSTAASDGSLTGPSVRRVRFGVAFRLVGALLAIAAFVLIAIAMTGAVPAEWMKKTAAPAAVQ